MPKLMKPRGRAATLLLAAIGFAALGLIAPRFGSSAEPAAPNSDATAAQLIAQLGADQFSLRNAATDRLSQMGIEIKPALTAALSDSDPEIRLRARQVLDVVIERDYQKRLAAFADDAQDSLHIDLPGWSRYHEIAGGEPMARRLFLEMSRAEPDLLESIAEGPEAEARAVEARLTLPAFNGPPLPQIPNAGQVGPSTMAALLFVGSDERVKLSDEVSTQLSNWLARSTFGQRIPGTLSEPMKRMLGAWVARKGAGQATLRISLVMAMQHQLKEGLEPAVAALRNPSTDNYNTMYALLLLGKLGNKTHLPVVELHLKNAVIVFPGMNPNMPANARPPNVARREETQVRDVALAVDLHLRGLDPKTFGFNHVRINSFTLFDPQSLGFPTQADREAAHKKRETWQAAQTKLDAATKKPAEAKPPEKQPAEKKPGDKVPAEKQPAAK